MTDNFRTTRCNQCGQPATLGGDMGTTRYYWCNACDMDVAVYFGTLADFDPTPEDDGRAWPQADNE